MSRKIAIKRLTESDLTLFEFHHRKTAGKQKAININANVLIGSFYPELPQISHARSGKFPVDFFIYGPQAGKELNLQRKLIRSHKNWRLDGELITSAITENDGRFDRLVEGDIAVMEFGGEQFPDSIWLVFVEHAGDPLLHEALSGLLGGSSMVAITDADLDGVVERAVLGERHPLRYLLIEEILEDAALSGEKGTDLLVMRLSGRRVSHAQLLAARKAATDAGALGEEFVNEHLTQLLNAASIRAFSWESMGNAVSPFDFLITSSDGSLVRVDVKSTSGNFDRIMHISLNELKFMADPSCRYDIYRVYEMKEGIAQLRITEDVGAVAASILKGLQAMPKGCTVDSVSVEAGLFQFGRSITIELNPAE